MKGALLALFLFVAATPGKEPKPFETTIRNLHFPVEVKKEERDKCHELWLWVSTDRGKTWKVAEQTGPKSVAFNYKVPEIGLYWFNLQIVYKDMTRSPRDVAKEPPAIRLLVQDEEKEMPKKKP